MRPEKKLIGIKILHTLIWLFFVSVIMYIVYCGITDSVGVFTWVAIGLIIGEGATLLAFKLSCPLTVLARKFSDSKKHNFDIYLPEWLAQYNKEIFTTIFLMGLVLVLFRVLF